MSPRLTLGLLALFLALGGYVYFSPQSGPGGSSAQAKGPAAKDTPADAQAEVFTFEDRDSQRLAVRAGERQTTIEKDAEGTWRLQPGNEPADRTRISSVLLRLAGLRASRRIAEAGNLADYGLTTPSLAVTVRQADGTEFDLLLGAKAPAEAGTYAKRPEDSTVFVVSNALVQDLERLVTEPPLQPTPAPTVPPVRPTPAPDPGPTGTPAP